MIKYKKLCGLKNLQNCKIIWGAGGGENGSGGKNEN